MRHGCALAAGRLGAATLLALAVPCATAQVPAPDCGLRPTDAAPGDFFACALAVDGDDAAIPSLLDDDRGTDSGSVYVFARQGNGWGPTAKLLAADGASGDQLGATIAIAGGRIAAGAPGHDAAGDQAGAVYVFARSADGSWAQAAKLVPTGLGARDDLGRAVAVSGSLVAAGALGDDDRGSSAGAVYVFDLDSGQFAKVTAADGAAGDGFGFALALAGDRLIVGAPWDDDGGAQAGAAYVFERVGGAWTQRAKLTAADRRPGCLFGGAVAVAGDRAAVGARLDDGAGTDAGAAYVFRGSGSAWSQEAKLTPPGLAPGDELGCSLALDGDALLAGARRADLPGTTNAGAAFLFVRGAGGWEVAARLDDPTPSAGEEFGFAVALAGDRALVGAFRDDTGPGGTDAGAACGFAGLPVGPPGPPPDPPPDPTSLADLRIDVTDGRDEAPPGATLDYRIRVHNAGPAGANGARVVDDFRPELTGCTWTCNATDGAACAAVAGAGAIHQTLAAFPAGGRATFRARCQVAAGFTGTLDNRARVEPPTGLIDPVPDNNEERDLTVIGDVPSPLAADLSIVKTDSLTEVAAGESVTYSIVVANAGPDPAPGARVIDDLPPGLACGPWTCTPAGGATCGDAAGRVEDPLDDTLDLPVGGSVTYAVTCAVPEDEGDADPTPVVVGPPSVP